MIGKISGIVDEIDLNTLIVMTQSGVGYRIHTSGRFAPQKGEEVSLYIQTVIREDAFELYGFETKQAQQTFLLLTSVQGVGNRVGMTILSALSEEQIYQALGIGDEAVFKSVSGIGPKLAKRIVSELKDKVGGIDIFTPESTMKTSSSLEKECVSALVNLGYKAHFVTPIVKKTISDHPTETLEALIPLLLKNLSL